MKLLSGFRRAMALAVSLVPLAVAAPAAAQMRAFQLTSDNDAYNFWIPMAVRPDYEYSNGLRLAVETEGAGRWRRLASALAPCAAGKAEPDAEAGCASTTFEAGQRLYSPRQDSYEPMAGQRPYAGWLYAAATGRVVDGRTRHTVGIEAGVTGAPSLGQPVMETLHRVGGFWAPVGWRHQLAFEPAVAVRYGVEQRVAEARMGGVRAADVVAQAGASVGNLRTAAQVGARARAGYRLAHPWAARAQRGISVYVTAGAEGEVVAHDLFLDGNTFGGDRRVTREPLVAETSWGVGIATHPLGIEYRVQRRSRSYAEEPGGHPYSTIEITWRR
ncbi:MAG TPA: lipid A deacylase LpxR family protein [Longimicrobium sp.]|nr:lipid A deacylase LpxR family protein [Longimicrobium sp.]